TFDGTTSKIYINGVEDNSATYSPLLINSNTTELQIGAKYGDNRWEGDLDEIRLYKRALSASEIGNLANSSQGLRILGNVNETSENGEGENDDDGDLKSTQREPALTTRMYPNPVDDVINLELSGVMEEEVQIYIFDMRGVQIMEEEYEIKKGRLAIDISKHHLAQGMHVLLVNRNGRQEVFKFIKR
ncbi:MAG: LamG-like jellyroll fold domain-containing protein, partial [Cyclobacteriaceae bacterium]